jgi:hypothetical protein
MDPDERRQFKKQLHHAARERGHRDLDGDGIPDDPESMAATPTRCAGATLTC